jgi:hypothetical protein
VRKGRTGPRLRNVHGEKEVNLCASRYRVGFSNEVQYLHTSSLAEEKLEKARANKNAANKLDMTTQGKTNENLLQRN